MSTESWILSRNFVVRDGAWKGQQGLEYRHPHYGTVIAWPATGTASLWVTSQASDDWNAKPHAVLCGEETHGPGSIGYDGIENLFAAIEAACVVAQ